MSSSPPLNRIAQLETRDLGSATAIMVAVNMDDKSTADPFVKETLHQILMHRMISPPDTALLCISLIGSVTSQEFALLWSKHLAGEPAMAVFLQRMQAADVVHGTRQGTVLDQTSLLESRGASPSSPPTGRGGSSSGSTDGPGWLGRLKSRLKGGRA